MKQTENMSLAAKEPRVRLNPTQGIKAVAVLAAAPPGCSCMHPATHRQLGPTKPHAQL